MATIALIIVIIFWNPQKLIKLYFDDCSKIIQENKKNNKNENVN